jgi:REP element-mobilizing transposase RayT
MSKQLSFKKVSGWGGKRRGAGRPNRSGTVSHGKRESVDFKKPLHLTLKLKGDAPNLRTKHLFRDFRAAARQVKAFGLHLIHFSVLSNHIHLLAEAKDSGALARGMKSLSGRFGKAIRRVIGGRGSVFAGRFHMHILRTPTEMKRALEYVLLNHVKHQKTVEYLDDFSSAFAFKDWRALIGRRLNGLIEDQVQSYSHDFEELSVAQSWLCRVGWKRAVN